MTAWSQAVQVTYSFTQINQYLRCPRSYRYRYLDGLREKDTRAAMVFGRCFETALAAYFRLEDPSAMLFKEWSVFRDTAFEYKTGDSWDRCKNCLIDWKTTTSRYSEGPEGLLTLDPQTREHTLR